jgi:2'-hydroxyisoflavone reductase
MENLLIVGGSYFAGRVFAEKLLERREFNVFVYNRGNLTLNKKEVTEIAGDRERPEQIRTRIPAMDWTAVIDFCAYTPEHIRSMVDNLPGKLSHYIFISTTTVCTETNDLPILESADKVLAPQPELGPYADYGFNKYRAECELAELSRFNGFHYTVLRPAVIYGRYNYAPRESYFFDLIEANRMITIPDSGLPLYSFLWVDDLASLILQSINNERIFGEAFNVCGPELISYERLLETLKIVCGRLPAVQRLSASEIDRRRLPLPFPLDRHLIYSCDKIRKATGFDFTPFVNGLRATWHHYRLLARSR